MIPRLLNNRYQIIRTLGSGGFGETFLAQDTHLPSHRICVIKQLKPINDKPQVYQLLQARFAREAAILESLGEGHQQIPKLYAYFIENDNFYLVQELVEGATLNEKLQNEGLFHESLVTEILISILGVLDYIHSQGIIHRDIKPSNIIYRQQDNKPVLIDFGIAKEMMNSVVDTEGKITTSIVVGTPGFMPPEQAAGKPVYGSDIYSLGITAIYLLTGKRPQDLPHHPQTGEVVWNFELNINSNLAKVLKKVVKSHPRDRYTTAKAMLADLYPQDRILSNFSTTRLISPENTLNQETRKWEQTSNSQLTIPTQKTSTNTINYSRQSYRNRQILLNKVKNYWIKGVLETSLHGLALIELGLENRLDVLARPWGMIWETPEQARQALPNNTKIIDLFHQMGDGRSLLILGEPGSGKTTTLLELARDLITIAEQDINQQIPVIFNLSAWTNEKITIGEWLVRELNTKYQVSQEIGKTWLANQQLLLLLDGLDEVSSERRENCVAAINKFIQEYGETEIVVCSRIQDYESLSNRLSFQGAVLIQPLSLEQIHQYFQSAGSKLDAVRTALKTDAKLQELAKSPLMLSIITLAYQGISITDLPGISIEEHRQHLFDKYIQRMLSRRITQNSYSKQKTIHYLTWLATKMKQQSQTVFLIERMQPDCLPSKLQNFIYVFCCLLTFVLLGLFLGIQFIHFERAILVIFFTTIFFWLLFGFDRIHPVETLKWSWKNTKNNLLIGLVGGTILGVILKLTAVIVYATTTNLQGFTKYIRELSMYSWMRGIVFGLSLGLIFALIKGLTSPTIQKQTSPNQGIWQSGKNALVFGSIGFIVLSLAAIFLHWRILAWGFFGLSFGIAAGGGEACAKHLILRIILFSSGYIPWNYAGFLDYATERILLQKVGGGYIFVHRLLLEYFAKMGN
ncbi:MAG: protein kinase [Nostocaceae cyanobacterium]|nr:protein kinase [Nostocaceae cyanobacterium]